MDNSPPLVTAVNEAFSTVTAAIKPIHCGFRVMIDLFIDHAMFLLFYICHCFLVHPRDFAIEIPLTN